MNRYFTGSTGLVGAVALSLVLGMGLPQADAASTPAPANTASTKPEAAAKPIPKNPVIAIVDSHKIHLSELAKAAQSLPPQLQQAPPQELYPVLLNRLVDERALLIQARKAHIAKKPSVKVAMRHAADRALEAAYLREQVKPKLSAQAVKAYYQKHYVGQKQPEEVKARQILVKTQAKAEAIVKKLNGGAKFAALAEKDSIDPGAKNGGELGWFTKDEMVKPFADAAFALKPGTYTKTPVHSQFGWHIILSQGKRRKPVPSLATVKDKIRQTLTDKAITDALQDARKGVTVKLFNPNGSPATAPAAAPAKN